MSDTVEYETLDGVHDALVSWESEGKAYEFGDALWKTAEKCVRSEPKSEYYGKQKRATAVFLVLRREGSLRRCLTDDFRRLVIRYHARGLSTTAAIEAILSDDSMSGVTPFWVFKHSGVCGYKNIKDFLVSRVSYLKPSHPRFPKKFSDYWRSERADYVDTIKEIPLSHPIEQLSKLSEHYTELEMAYESAQSAMDKERFHKCMLRTMAAIHLITRDPSVSASRGGAAIPEASRHALGTPPADVIDIPAASVSDVKSKGETDA